eukprot:357000-Chlamydomonas_euryale.AAC.12
MDLHQRAAHFAHTQQEVGCRLVLTRYGQPWNANQCLLRPCSAVAMVHFINVINISASVSAELSPVHSLT